MIALRGVTKTFESGYTALRDVDLEVEPQRFVALVGPSGCGKSTTLSLIAGLDGPTGGTVSVRGKPVAGITERAGFLFQRDALLPWKSVRENVLLPLQLRGVRGEPARARAAEWIGRVGLRGFEASYPHQLSGGMRKRVSLAQTLVYDPEILLMDEPFSALDVQTRNLMEGELLSLWQGSGKTVIFVTHDLEEAIALADEVVVMTAGPARVKARYDVTLPRPRDIEQVRFDPRFTELYSKMWNDLRDEVLESYARANAAG
ncbi:MAG TPA: ABC transporter ATP-binding protein [Candidatus Elarobacter sp.]|nr:ABC transporter ATP-binding protein [Dongiaceae bacterium]HZW53037.1 ABC transporter ATP-binding protein [Candidatus Elarobacter sp.]